MGWVRIDDNAPHHRKQLKAGPAACWLWVCGLAYCQRMLTDGFIPSEAIHTLGVKDWKKLTHPLLVVGLWEAVTGGYRVHDYLAFNASRDERDEKAASHRERTAKWRARRDMSPPLQGDAPVTCHTESGVTSSVTVLPSPPTPTPNPIPSHPTTPSSPVVVGPLAFEKLKQKFAHVGARLRIPHVLHSELRTKLGGVDPHGTLLAWYAVLDADVEQSGEAIPDIFEWLRPRFVQWAKDISYAAELEKFRPKEA